VDDILNVCNMLMVTSGFSFVATVAERSKVKFWGFFLETLDVLTDGNYLGLDLVDGVLIRLTDGKMAAGFGEDTAGTIQIVRILERGHFMTQNPVEDTTTLDP
jgi:hypothetical protein